MASNVMGSAIERGKKGRTICHNLPLRTPVTTKCGSKPRIKVSRCRSGGSVSFAMFLLLLSTLISDTNAKRVILSTKPIGLTITAWVLALVSTLVSILAMVFVIAFRSNRIVTLGQPFFLFLICVGSLLISISLYFDAGSIEEIPDITWNDLDKLCVLQLWCLYLGILMVLVALICKLWRAEKACQFRKNRRIMVRHVIWPFCTILVLELCLLVVATTVCPPYWHEILMDPYGDPSALGLVNNGTIAQTSNSNVTNTTETSIESGIDSGSEIFGFDEIGFEEEPSLDDLIPKCFYSPLPAVTALRAISHMLIIIAQILVIWMGHQTRKLSDDLVDTDHVFFMMVCLLALYIPFLFLEYGVIPIGRGYHYCTLIFPFCLSMLSIGFLIAPKVYWVFYQKKYGKYPDYRSSSSTRMSLAGSGRIHVSGVGPSLKKNAAAAAATTAWTSGSSSTSHLEAGHRSPTNGRKEAKGKRHVDFAPNAEGSSRVYINNDEDDDMYDGVEAVPSGDGNSE